MDEVESDRYVSSFDYIVISRVAGIEIVSDPEGIEADDSKEPPRGGQQFRAAQGSMVPNRGQMRPTLLLETGQLGTFTFQETDVVTPLLAVSYLNTKGNACWFDGAESFIIPKGSRELLDIRFLEGECSQLARLEEQGGPHLPSVGDHTALGGPKLLSSPRPRRRFDRAAGEVATVRYGGVGP